MPAAMGFVALLAAALALVAVQKPLLAADALEAELDALRPLRGAAYEKARDALLADPKAKEMLAAREKAAPGDWLAAALTARLDKPDLAKAADAWQPQDQFDTKVRGLDADVIDVKGMAALKLKIMAGKFFFGPGPRDPGCDGGAYLALFLERLAQNPADNSDGFRLWTFYDGWSYLPVSKNEQDRWGQIALANGKDPAAAVNMIGARNRSWLAVLLKPGNDPVLRLAAAIRLPGQDSEAVLQGFAKQNAPLGALAALMYGGCGPSPYTLGKPILHAVWLENWAGQMKPEQTDFVQKLFTEPEPPNPESEGPMAPIEYNAASLADRLGISSIIAGVLQTGNKNLFDAKFQATYEDHYRTKIVTQFSGLDELPADATPPPAVQSQFFAAARVMGRHLDPEGQKALSALKLKSAYVKRLREETLTGGKDFKTPFFSGADVDELLNSMRSTNRGTEGGEGGVK
ncbi:MAG: hypothetical protein ACREJ2_11210 [Planctomycetota bacterium]